jgi:hypothetical protein
MLVGTYQDRVPPNEQSLRDCSRPSVCSVTTVLWSLQLLWLLLFNPFPLESG